MSFTSNANILIVDNEPRVCRSLQYLLSAQGYDPDTACTGIDGRDLVSRKVYGVAIVDMIMPEMNGFALMRHIREASPETLIVAMTGYASTESATKALRLGAYDYLVKPFDFDRLKETVGRAVETVCSRVSYNVSNEVCRTLLENAPDPIYGLDAEGRFIFVNNRFSKILGLETEQVVGAHYSEIVAPEDLCRARWHLNERRASERCTRDCKLRLLVKNSTDDLVVTLDAVGVYKPTGRTSVSMFVGTCGIARNIGEDPADHERRRHEILRTFAGGVAHNFNNALSIVSGYTSLLETQYPPGRNVQNGFQAITSAVSRMTELTNGLLDYSKQQVTGLVPVCLNDVITRIVEGLSYEMKVVPAALEVDLSPNLSLIDGDTQYIERALRNIVVNAYEAIEKGGIITISTRNLRVSFGFRKGHPELLKERYVFVRIGDSGTGIDKKTLKRIFEPFFSTRFTGRGLGLAASLGIIKAHGGHIYVKSRRGEGTVVSVLLPISQM